MWSKSFTWFSKPGWFCAPLPLRPHTHTHTLSLNSFCISRHSGTEVSGILRVASWVLLPQSLDEFPFNCYAFFSFFFVTQLLPMLSLCISFHLFFCSSSFNVISQKSFSCLLKILVRPLYFLSQHLLPIIITFLLMWSFGICHHHETVISLRVSTRAVLFTDTPLTSCKCQAG